jgi:predicted nucleotidyltransferase
MHRLIKENREAIVELCRRYGVARMEVFGSVCTPDFDPVRSDIDFLVEYPPNYDFRPWMGRLQDLEADLATLLGRDVDLVTATPLNNKWFRREAAETRTVIYNAAQITEVA